MDRRQQKTRTAIFTCNQRTPTDGFAEQNGRDAERVNTDELVHTARSSSACFPVFQCTLSAA